MSINFLKKWISNEGNNKWIGKRNWDYFWKFLVCVHLWLFFFFQLLSVDNLVSSPFFCSSVSLDKSVSLIKMRHLLAEARRDVKVFCGLLASSMGWDSPVATPLTLPGRTDKRTSSSWPLVGPALTPIANGTHFTRQDIFNSMVSMQDLGFLQSAN